MDTTTPILPVKGGTIVITGAKGTGKTFLAATYAPPGMEGKVFWHDSERSASNVIQQLASMGKEFGHYRNLTSRFDNLPDERDLLARIDSGDLPWVSGKQQSALADYYEFVIHDLNASMGKGEYSVYVHDTIETLESGMAAYVGLNKRITGWTRDSHGRMWSEAVFPLYEHLIESLYTRGIETVIFCSHIKTPWENNQPVPNAVTPAGKKILYRLSSLMIWLVNETDAPAGLVLKERLGKLSIVDGEWETKRMLPRRIPRCTWREIKRYLRDGCDLVNPGEGEELSRREKEMISDLLSDAQMELMILTARQQVQSIGKQVEKPIPPEIQQETDEVKVLAIEKRERGLSNEEIRAELLAEEHSIPTVIRVMKEIGG